MASIQAGARQLIARARVGHLATSGEGRPTVVPVCFVLLGDTIYHAIDAKPKRVAPEKLRRVRNVMRNPRAALLVDQYREDWSRLWFILLEGRARVLKSGREHQRAIAALERKYRQYVRMPLAQDALVIAIDVERRYYWRSS